MTPDEHTIQESFLDVGDGHQLYIYEWGNPKAKMPMIFVHGGPGSKVKDWSKALFDPSKHRVIFYDQRGCGKSLPYGSLENNTTDELVEDIEKIAKHFKLDKFILVGGSWGSCLPLVYAIMHPQRIAAMVLNGIFLGTQEEIEWIDSGHFKTFFPDVWDEYLAATPTNHRHKPSQYHFDKILNGSETEMRDSAYAYGKLESSVLALDDRRQFEDIADYDPTGTIIEVSYLKNNCYLPDNFIMKNASKLTMPVWLVQGRYDAVCPPITAYRLHQKLPNSQLIFTTSGHKSSRESWNVQRTILSQWS